MKPQRADVPSDPVPDMGGEGSCARRGGRYDGGCEAQAADENRARPQAKQTWPTYRETPRAAKIRSHERGKRAENHYTAAAPR